MTPRSTTSPTFPPGRSSRATTPPAPGAALPASTISACSPGTRAAASSNTRSRRAPREFFRRKPANSSTDWFARPSPAPKRLPARRARRERMWSFETDPDFQAQLDWMRDFVKQKVEPLDYRFPGHGAPYDVANKESRAAIKPLQDEVKARGLWACHLGPHLGGPGYGQVKLGLMNEILGRAYWAPTVFGTAAPDTGNAEILAMFGSPEQKARYLAPLMAGEIVSCFSMTEPQAGADPTEFTCRARQEGNEWVIEGEKWFSSNARFAAFLIVMAVTDPEAPPHRRMSMFIVPVETPGVEFIRHVQTMGDCLGEDDGTHAYIRYNQVRVPADAMLGGPGEGFKVAQARLGGGRIHHAMRTVGKCQRAIDMMLER